MKRFNVEFTVGLFLLLGVASFFYLAVKLGDVGLFADEQRYTLKARFDNTSGLKEGAFVELAGVRIGRVSTIELDTDSYESVVSISLPEEVQVQEDSIVSIRTAGIIGDRFLKLTPGGMDIYLADGDEIIETESSISIEELVSKYIFESGQAGGQNAD